MLLIHLPTRYFDLNSGILHFFIPDDITSYIKVEVYDLF